jgi:hypothetical protein
LFNPLRGQVQDFIDRRFYRKKYDAERELAQFATTPRDEVDMKMLTIALLEWWRRPYSQLRSVGT